ncbi:hypothetical protein [Ruminococcus flavefaciens]|uniref:hypothetical protein n=1 Tax=Ruminococcus flavefaciens TaxID=1265 RepID=UPI0026EEBD8B|nr:hypothetical protein [Ruminococcus flavefaciens]
MTNIKRSIKPVIFCLLSVALSAFCIREIIKTILSEKTSHLNFTQNAFLNVIIDTVHSFNERLQVGYLIGIGFLALLFELAFSDSMYEFFSRLPLGAIKKYNYFDNSKHGFKYLFKHSVAAISPALIIGLYVLLYIAFCDWYPDNLDICVRWILPITIILTLIASVVLIASVIKYGGLWGALIRLPLLFTSNICLCSIIGALIFSFGFAIAMFLSFLIGIIGMIVFLPLVLSRRR